MNLLDILILIPILLLAFQGFRKGFIISVASLIALILGIYASVYYSDITETYINSYFSLTDKQSHVLAFILTFIIVVILIHLIGKIIQRFFSLIALSFLDKMVGAAFGILKAVIFVSAIFWVIHNFDSNQKIISQKLKQESIFYQHVFMFVPTILPMIDMDILKFEDKNTNEENDAQIV